MGTPSFSLFNSKSQITLLIVFVFMTYILPPSVFALSDLIISDITVNNSSPVAGDAIKVTTTIKNIGDTSPNTTVYLDTYAKDSSGTQLWSSGGASINNAVFGPEQSYSIPLSIIFKPNKADTFTLYGVADSNSWHEEKDETNNILTKQLIVSPAPACSSDSECGGKYFPSSGATFCGSGSDVNKRMKYQVVPVCVSGSCSEKTEPGVLEDCAASGKICGFSPLQGGQFQCVAATSVICKTGVAITFQCLCGELSYESYGYCCLDAYGKLYHYHTSCPQVVCPTCPDGQSPSSWSACANNNQSRTNHKCDASTNYQCQSYTETQSCTVTPLPPATTGYCGDKICSGNETSATCPNDCVSPVTPPTTPQSTPNATTPPQPVIQPNLTTPKEKIIPLPVPTPLPPPVALPPPSPTAPTPPPSLEPTKPLPAVDRLRLAQSILNIESLKIKFESLKSKSQSLLKYHTIKNDINNTDKWDKVVGLFNEAIEALDNIKSFISSVRDTATEADLDKIVNRIDNVLLIIDKIIDVMLSG